MSDILDFDPFAAAEKITGESYKDSALTKELGMALLAEHSAQKAEVLSGEDDTHFRMTFADLRRIYDELGFQVIHEHEFVGSYNGVREAFLVLWRDGVLATAESYSGDRVNTTSLYYNWRANDEESAVRLRSSGRFVTEALDRGEYIDIGNRQVREGLRRTIKDMDANGTFLNPWIETPHLWFVDYSQSRNDYDYDSTRIRRQVMSTFPQEIQDAISGK